MSQTSIEQELMYLRDMVSLAKEGRCMACGWPLAESAEKGCIPNNCCFRPSEHSVEYEPWFNRQQLLHRDSAHLAAVESQAGQADAPKFLTDTEETYTLLLKAERDQIVQLEQWKRDAEIGMGALRAEIAQLTRERDEYKASYYTAHKNLCTTTSERDEAKQSR